MPSTHTLRWIPALALTFVAHCGASTTQTSDTRSADAVTTGDTSTPADVVALDTVTTDAVTTDAVIATDAAVLDAASTPDVAAVETGADTSAPSDASADAPRPDATSVACTGERTSCAFSSDGMTCGDTVQPADCVAGAWTCPTGTIESSRCTCSGRPPGSSCTCTSGGWVCADAGGPDAPGDTSSSACIGRPAGCSVRNRDGSCSDVTTSPMCVDGAWRCPEGTIPRTECSPTCTGGVCTVDTGTAVDAASDAAGDAARTFACGPTLRCTGGEQYCQATLGGVSTTPRYACLALPSACLPRPTCACLPSGGSTCTQSADGDLTRQILAP